MADFWNSALTEKSWKILTGLVKEPFSFIVIGGWAAYLWTNLHKSKDVDIVVADIKELEYIKQKYSLKKNDNLKKYEISFDEIDVDIYVPYYSPLTIPAEDLKGYATKISNIPVLKPEALLVLKQGAWLQRKESVKGQKDQIDIMALLCFSDINFKLYFAILKKYNLTSYFQQLKSIISSFKDHDYLSLTPRELKLRKKSILQKIKEV